VTDLPTGSDHLLQLFPVDGPEVDRRCQFNEISKGKEVPRKQESDIELERLHTFLSTLGIQRISSEGQSTIKGPESHYRLYRTVEDLPSAATPFYEVAARVIGCALPKMVLAVFNIEQILQKGGKGAPEGSVGPEVSDDSFESDADMTSSSAENGSSS
jgi:hypothetical protein